MRSKSALEQGLNKPTKTPAQTLQRPRTTANHLRIATNHPPINSVDAKLGISTDNLNLKTFQEVDRITEVINSGIVNMSTDPCKEKERADIYKKFWHLKSTGQYHGSLLAKPRLVAPEIRE